MVIYTWDSSYKMREKVTGNLNGPMEMSIMVNTRIINAMGMV